MQRTFGNHRLERLLQTKLTVSQPDDVYEQEAERVADEVMRMPEPDAAAIDASSAARRVQRLCAECEEGLQRQVPLKEEEQLIQGHREDAGLQQDTSAIEPYVDNLSGRGEPLAPATRAFFEPRFGADFSAVRVHDDGTAAESARAVNARAFTVGRDIVFGAGTYSPESQSGRRLLAHELTHVIQQGEGLQQTEVSARLYRQDAAVAPAAPAPTSDPLLNEWLGEHAASHLSSDLTWILAQWPSGGSINDLGADFGQDVQGLLTFVAATPGASFEIFSYARSADKQHVMHVGQYIRKSWTGYNSYKFSLWPDVVAAGGSAGLQALAADDRKEKLAAIANPEVLNIVWDTGTQSSSKTDGSAVAAAYGIGLDNPVANSGAAYSWPTGNTSISPHGSGNAVDAEPVALPNSVTIRSDQARAWPDLATVQGIFGAVNVVHLAATETQAEGYTITGVNAVARRDAFLDTFFEVRSAARAGFADLEHFQAP